MLYSSCNTEWDRQNLLSVWAIFAIYTLTTQKIKILKKWKKHPEISLFYTWVPTIMIIKCMLPEIWSVTDFFFFVILAHFLPFYPYTKNQNFEKTKKKNMLGDRFTQVHHKWKLYDTLPPSILKSKGMCSILLKKGKKEQNIWKFGQNGTKLKPNKTTIC